MLWDTLKVLVWTGLIFYILVSGVAFFTGNVNANFLRIMAFALCGVLAGLAFLFLAVMLLYFGNRFTARFAVFPGGIAYDSVSRRARFSNRAAIVVGALAGSPQAVGAGLVATAGESGYFEWTDLRSVKEHPAHRVLSLFNSWRCVLRLYCSPENYDVVRDLVRSRLPAATVRGGDPTRTVALLRGLTIGLAATLATWNGSLSPWMAGGCLLLAAAGAMEGVGAVLMAILGCAGIAGEAFQILPNLVSLEWRRLVPMLIGFTGAAAFGVNVLVRSRRAAEIVTGLFLLAALLAGRTGPLFRGLP